MNRFDRGAYKSGEDNRIFDDSEYEDDVTGSRLPLLIVLALLVLAMFAGVTWMAYNQGVASGRTETPVPVQASSNEVSITPVPAPLKSAPVVIGAPAAVARENLPPVMRPGVPNRLAAASPGSPAASKPLAGTTAGTPELPVARGAYTLQIGAYKSKADADSFWRIFRTRHSALLADADDVVQQVDLGDKGVWYRLRITGFTSKALALAMCERLRADGGSCFLGK